MPNFTKIERGPDFFLLIWYGMTHIGAIEYAFSFITESRADMGFKDVICDFCTAKNNLLIVHHASIYEFKAFQFLKLYYNYSGFNYNKIRGHPFGSHSREHADLSMYFGTLYSRGVLGGSYGSRNPF